MPHYCCAYGCTKNSAFDKDVSFHTFPLKNVDLTKEWLFRIQRDRFKPSIYSRICSTHFDSNCFEAETFRSRRRLKPDAVPTKFCFIEGNNRIVEGNNRLRKLLHRTPAGFPPSPSTDDQDNSDYLPCLEQDMQVLGDMQIVGYEGIAAEQITPNDVPDEGDNAAEDSQQRHSEETGSEPVRKRAKADQLPASASYSTVEEEMYFFFTSLIPDMKHFSRKQIFRIKRKVLEVIEEVGAEE